jgi:hypothetical protein
MNKPKFKCFYCGATLKPNYERAEKPSEWGWTQIKAPIIGIKSVGDHLTDNLFCSSQCARRYAVAIVKQSHPKECSKRNEAIENYDNYLKEDFHKNHVSIFKKLSKRVAKEKEAQAQRLEEIE